MVGVVRVMGLVLLGGCTVQGPGQPSTMPEGGEVPAESGAEGPGDVIEAGCGFNGTQLQGEIGSEFQVACPANCQAEGATWGSDVYTLDSGLCRAGIHAGAIPTSGGMIQVRIEPGRPAYRGTARNGIQSSDYGQYPKSFVVLAGGEGGGPVAEGGEGGGDDGGGEPAGGDGGGGGGGGGSDVIEAGCGYNGTQIVGEIGTHVVVNCPAGCAGEGATWGSGHYTLDSGVCRAAIHAGIIKDSGGDVGVTIEPGRPAYRGSLKNGIQSSDYGNYPKSFKVGRP